MNFDKIKMFSRSTAQLYRVPVQESLAAEHAGEVLGDALEHLLDGGGVAQEGHGHLQTLRRDVADGGLDVVRDPLDEVGGVLVLDVQHLLVDLLGGHAAAEEATGGEITAMSGVGLLKKYKIGFRT